MLSPRAGKPHQLQPSYSGRRNSSYFLSFVLNFVSQQPNIIDYVTADVQRRFGWEAGQLGDAVCFFAVAYRAKDQKVNTLM